jgi:hypothetical protein
MTNRATRTSHVGAATENQDQLLELLSRVRLAGWFQEPLLSRVRRARRRCCSGVATLGWSGGARLRVDQLRFLRG